MKLTETNFGPLAPHLIDLAAAFQGRGLPLSLVGGSGLLLRRLYRTAETVSTLIDTVPVARTTDDFDLLLRLEVLADAEQRLAIREALTELGYQTYAKNFQFIKSGTGDAALGRREVKVDFLAPMPGADASGLKVSSHRVGATKSGKDDSLHGYATEEAVLTDEPPLSLTLEGRGTDSTERHSEVLLPHPFTLLIMKLHAFRDAHLGNERHEEPRPELARKHVADVYTLVALLTQAEETSLAALSKRYAGHPAMQESVSIVGSLLTGTTSQGTLVLREALSIDPDDLLTFLEVLGSTFG